MLYQATEADLPAIRAFLAPRLATSMFLSGNLRDQGLGGSHPRGMTLWFSKGKSGITNVIGCANSGYLVCEAPGLTEDLFASLRDRLARRALRGVNGVAAQISGVLRALELPMPCAVMDAVEPHYRLDLAQLLVPGGQSTLRRAEPEDLQLLTDWRWPPKWRSWAEAIRRKTGRRPAPACRNCSRPTGCGC